MAHNYISHKCEALPVEIAVDLKSPVCNLKVKKILFQVCPHFPPFSAAYSVVNCFESGVAPGYPVVSSEPAGLRLAPRQFEFSPPRNSAAPKLSGQEFEEQIQKILLSRCLNVMKTVQDAALAKCRAKTMEKTVDGAAAFGDEEADTAARRGAIADSLHVIGSFVAWGPHTMWAESRVPINMIMAHAELYSDAYLFSRRKITGVYDVGDGDFVCFYWPAVAG